MPTEPRFTNDEAPPRAGRMLSGLAGGGSLRWVAADLTGPVRESCQLLDLSPLAAAALGRCLTGAVLLQRMAVKTPSRLVLELAGDGPLRKVLAEVNRSGEVRGMVAEPRVASPPSADGDLAVGEAIGSGLLKVWRLHGKSSYESQVELRRGGVGLALAHYLMQSEQTRSAALLGILAAPSGVVAAGGVLFEVMPGADPESVARLEGNIEDDPQGPGRLLAGGGLEGLLDSALFGLDRRTLETGELVYRCGCSAASIRGYLGCLGAAERAELAGEGGRLEAECVFCGTVYRLAETAQAPQTIH